MKIVANIQSIFIVEFGLKGQPNIAHSVSLNREKTQGNALGKKLRNNLALKGRSNKLLKFLKNAPSGLAKEAISNPGRCPSSLSDFYRFRVFWELFGGLKTIPTGVIVA